MGRGGVGETFTCTAGFTVLSASHSVVSSSLPPVACSPPGSSAHGLLQARMLECAAMPFPGDLPAGSPAFQAGSFTV